MSSLVNNQSQFQEYSFRYYPSKEAIKQAHDDAIDQINRIWRSVIIGTYSSYIDVPKYLRADGKRLPDGVTTYEYPDKLNEALEKFDNLTSQIDMGGSFKKSRLKITADPRGVFSFGIAAKGLFKPQEYFSQELADEFPNEFDGLTSGIVPFKFVEERVSKIDSSAKEFWYKSKSGKYYECQKQQEGTRDVDLGLKKNKVFRTTTKKSYVMFEKKGGKAKLVDLYLPINMGFEFYNFLPLLLVAKYLKINGIATRVSALRIFDANGLSNTTCPLRSKMFGWSYPIKDYGDDFDYNDLALNGVDSRWWYNIYTYVKAISDLEIIKNNNSAPIDTLLDAGGSYPDTVRDMSDFFSRYRNWYLEEIDKGNIEPLRVDKKLLICGGLNTSSSDSDVLEEFYRILDTIDIQFNNMDAVCKRVYERNVTKKLEERYEELKALGRSQTDIDDELRILKVTLVDEYKVYITMLLTSTYSYPLMGQYAEPTESADKLDQEFEDKLQKLNTFLKNV